MKLIKDLGMSVAMAGIVLTPFIVLSGLGLAGFAAYQHYKKRA